MSSRWLAIVLAQFVVLSGANAQWARPGGVVAGRGPANVERRSRQRPTGNRGRGAHPSASSSRNRFTSFVRGMLLNSTYVSIPGSAGIHAMI